MRKSFILLLLGLVLPAQLFAATVSEFTLKNGLRLFVKEDHRAPVVVSQVWYKIGSSYEHAGLTGISHALEHMMFKGTEKHGASQLSKIVAENGGQQNAFTSYDFTGYYQIFEASKLPISFELEADRMRGLLLKDEDFKKEIQVVMEERRLRTDDNPQALTYERFMAAAHVANPYHHPIVGWMNDLENLTINDVRKWYQHWYAPNNAVVVVVGDVNAQDVYKLAKKHFGPLKSKHVEPIKPADSVKPLGKREVVVKAPAKLPMLIMGYNVPVVKTAKAKWEPYALVVLANILDGGNSARFAKELVREQQVAAKADAGYDLFDRLSSLFVMSGTPSQKYSVKDLQKAFLQQIKNLQKEQVKPEELARVKAQFLAEKIYDKDSMFSQAQEIGALESVGISWKEADQLVSRIEEVTPAQVQKVARKYLNDDRLTIAVLEPLPLTNKKPNPAAQGVLNHVR